MRIQGSSAASTSDQSVTSNAHVLRCLALRTQTQSQGRLCDPACFAECLAERVLQTLHGKQTSAETQGQRPVSAAIALLMLRVSRLALRQASC